MKKYDSYKDSGVEWIGEVPNSWDKSRIKFLLTNSIAGVWGDDEKGDENDIVCFRVADFDYSSGYLCFDKLTVRNILPKQLEGRTLHEGDLMIEKSGGGESTPVGRVVRFNYLGRATCSNFMHFITVNRDNSNNFLFYYFYAMYGNHVNMLFFNQTTGIQNLKVGEYLGQTIYLPKKDEQQSIASYLDKKCSEIDKVISAQQKRIALLQELKQSVITHAVTKGLNPNVEMKDSGVEWIGEVPNHWEIVPFKRTITINNGSDYKHIQVEDDGYPVIGSGGEFAKASQYVYDGEVVLLGRKGTIDKPMYYNGKFWTVDTMFYGVPKKNANCKYLYYQALNIPFERYATSTALPSMTQTDLNDNVICLPPFSEQTAIASYLDKKCALIDTSISKAQHQINLLQEYKQSLITEVVTGKRKVC